MKVHQRWFLAAAILLLVPLVFAAYSRANRDRDDDELRARWDIVHFTTFSPPTFEAGGKASALANDGSKITLTGSGTFEIGESREVTGGGTWETFAPGAIVHSASGTYKVTALIRFVEAPATLDGTPIVDLIADRTTAHSGLVALAIKYSDGSRGVLFVSCNLPGTPANPPSIFEGITASKGFVDYWSRVAPVAGVDGNRTVFHIRPEDEDKR